MCGKRIESYFTELLKDKGNLNQKLEESRAKEKKSNKFIAKIKVCIRNTLSSEYLQVQNNEHPEYGLNHKAILQVFRKNKYVCMNRGIRKQNLHLLQSIDNS